MKDVFSDMVTQINSDQQRAAEHADVESDSPEHWAGDPMAAAIRRESAAERDWESGASHLDKEDYVGLHSFNK